MTKSIDSLAELPFTNAYLTRINAEPRSLKTAVVREEGQHGYWRDVCVVKFNEDGFVGTFPLIAEKYPSEDEAENIKAEFKTIDWPDCAVIDLDHPDMPKMITEADEKDRFIFRNEQGEAVLIQIRQDVKGKKRYIPWTFWSDGKFRPCENGGSLPLYGLENIKEHSTVLIVEGAKTARHVQWMADGATPEAIAARKAHPWGEQLQHICVCGWSSGALSPDRTDWTPIQKNGITRAYVSLDNDSVGVAALPAIAKNLRCVTHALMFSEEWPVSADLYDDFPEKFFKEIDGNKYYIGPSFHDCLHPATYMTDLIEVLDSKTPKFVPVLRSHVRNLYQYMEEAQAFCYLEMPEIIRNAETLDAMLRPFSDTKKTSELLLANFNGRAISFDYSPETTKRRIIIDGRPVINLYTPPTLKAQDGSPEPWLEFLEQLIPIETERHQLKRWIATLYAKPEVRMIYAPLLVSQQTGTGKSTLGRILAHLVGMQNASFPSEQAIAGEFNAWIAQKRLVVINEIYQGKSWKMFNKLKDLITEPTVTLRKMHRDPMDISNWVHFCMFSNSFSALKVDSQDRRVFIPTVTETRWADDKWLAFHDWLSSGGYSIIANWCLNFGDYVKRGERAPDTERKTEMIESSRSKASMRIEELSDKLMEQEACSISVVEVQEWLDIVTKEKVYESPLEIRKMFQSFGCIDGKQVGIERVSHNGRLTYFIMNKKAFDKLSESSDIGFRKKALKEMTKSPNELVNEQEIM